MLTYLALDGVRCVRRWRGAWTYASIVPTNYQHLGVHPLRFRPRKSDLLTAVLATTLLVGLAVPAFAADEPKKGSDADEEFMLGIRKVGVMVGQAFVCTGEAARGSVGEDALELATQIATHFGLQAAFIFSGSFGYGTGSPFDTATCPATLANFKAVQQKYLNK